jgi:signal transduction histidine kinase
MIDPARGEAPLSPAWPGHGRQLATDAAIALAVTAAQLGVLAASPSWHGQHHPAPAWDVYLLLASASFVLVARRRFPVWVLAVSLAATLAAGAIGATGMIWIGLVAAFINAEMAGKRGAAAASLAIGYVASCWPPWQIGRPGQTGVTFALGLAAWLLILLAIAELVRARRQRAAALHRSQDEQLRRRASEDRIRLARDLHDVLAHNISVINVQANTALHLMDRQPDRAREALTAIHAVSKQALSELRTVLGVLREGGMAAAPRAPSPGLARLPDLLTEVRSAGLAVALTVDGQPWGLPASQDIAAYRVVQESLTNVRRHSAAASAAVTILYEPAGLHIQVEDAGPAVSPSRPHDAGGHGIGGMRERVRELGGTLSAGTTPAGGFRVTAWLPADTPSRTSTYGQPAAHAADRAAS